jgi:hypothetical protein
MTRNANTLLNPYQAMGTEIPNGMSVEEAWEYTQTGGYNVRLMKPVLMDEDGTIDVGDHRLIVGDVPSEKDGSRVKTVLGASKKGYGCFQWEQLSQPWVSALDGEGVKLTHMGAHDGGRAMYAAFDLPNGTMFGGEIRQFLLLKTRHDGSGSAVAAVVDERTWCANMINMLLRKGKNVISLRHTRNADPYLMQQVEVILGISEQWQADLAREVRELQSQPVTRKQFTSVVIPGVLGERPTEKGRSQSIFDRKFDEIAAAWYSPVAAEGDTAWRAYNAITEHEQHRRTSNVRRMAEATAAGRVPMEKRVVEVLAGMR